MTNLWRYLNWFVFFLLASVPMWSQADDSVTDEADATTIGEDRMLTPPLVSGQAYSVALDSEEHTNSLHYGVTFSTAYSDNVLGVTSGHQTSDIGYSVGPTIGLDKATTRLHWDLTYAPGFTFYQHTSERNQADQNASLGFEYRLSPHVTFSARDTFQKSSNVFNQPSVSAQVFGGVQGPNDSIIAPLADRLANYGTLEITYQYGRDDMIGAAGSFSNLHYSDPTQVSGLYDSSSRSGSTFYAHRISRQHYIGAAYQYADLLSYPERMNAETQVHSFFPFYTFYPNRRLSLSFFGGPQYSDTMQPAVESLGHPAFSLRGWSPAGGASLSWEGHFVSAALSYSHIVSESGGLIGAVRLDNASVSVHLQLSASLSASISGSYANNNVLGYAAGTNGHTNSGTVGLERRIGEHFTMQVGYIRLHQTYSIPAIAGAPTTNREFISFSYMFARPLGR